MRYSRVITMALLGALILAILGCSSEPTEKDVVGKWQSTKLENLWMEFYPTRLLRAANGPLPKTGVSSW